MDADGKRVLHWVPEKDSWREVGWDDFAAVREFLVEFRPLPGLNAGIQYFVVCVCDNQQTFNIIPHKYLVEPSGKIGADNFYGWNREERDDYHRLMLARESKPGDHERLQQIRQRVGNAMYPPRDSLYPLVRALPAPPRKGSAASAFLDTLAAETT